MTSVGVVHLDLMSKGGGEAVAMNVMEALQDEYDLSLLTVTEPDVAALNDYFNTAVDPDALTVREAGSLAPALHRQFGFRYYVIQNALLGRYARRHADEFDLLISTINELGLPPGSIEYVHFPFDWTTNLENRGDIFHPTIEDDCPYEWLCKHVADVSAETFAANTVFANSEWTADVFEDAYGTQPEILYPPVDTSEFAGLDWTDREPGFVTVGRVERSKRLAELIHVIDALRARDHGVHLHVIGPTYDRTYRRELDAMAESREYVHLEGELPRSTLVERICTHRYGLHGKAFEHFGMSVAELVAGGAIPFLPSSGGQQSIVHGDERLLFDSFGEAVEKIDRVLSNPHLQRELRFGRREVERRFGRDRFKDRIATAVSSSLDGSTTAVPSNRSPGVVQTDD